MMRSIRTTIPVTAYGKNAADGDYEPPPVRFSERGHLARIATVRADGSPSVVPVWFICEGGKVLITPRKHSAFLSNLRREPRVAITSDEDQGRYRKVLFEGSAEVLYEVGQDRKWDDVYRQIACRYIDEASADYYLTETKDQPRALIGVDQRKSQCDVPFFRLRIIRYNRFRKPIMAPTMMARCRYRKLNPG